MSNERTEEFSVLVVWNEMMRTRPLRAGGSFEPSCQFFLLDRLSRAERDRALSCHGSYFNGVGVTGWQVEDLRWLDELVSGTVAHGGPFVPSEGPAVPVLVCGWML